MPGPSPISRLTFPADIEVERRLRLYEVLANQQPQPFAWKFTRAKLEEFLKRLEAHGVMLLPGQTTRESPDTN